MILPRHTESVNVRLLAACFVLVGCGSTTAGPAIPENPSSAPTVAPTPSSVRASIPVAPSQPSSSGQSPAVSRRPAEEAGTTIIVADSAFGAMLFDASGQAIYLFDAEQTTRPECYDDCAVAWPPVLTVGRPQGLGRVKPDLLGTTRRGDGTTQVTYAGHPLYFYADEGKYEVLCHDIEGFGGTWLVVQPDGHPAPA